jgi:hypothetical protein
MNVVGADDLMTAFRAALDAARERNPGPHPSATYLEWAKNRAACAMRTTKGPNRRQFAIDAAALCLLAAEAEERAPLQTVA